MYIIYSNLNITKKQKNRNATLLFLKKKNKKGLKNKIKKGII